MERARPIRGVAARQRQILIFSKHVTQKMVSMCLAKFLRIGQQQQQGTTFAGVVYAIAAALLMKMIYVSRAHQATDTAEIDSASSLCHDYVSLHFYHYDD